MGRNPARIRGPDEVGQGPRIQPKGHRGTGGDRNKMTEILDMEQHIKMDSSGYKEEITYEKAITAEHAAIERRKMDGGTK
eukprot:391802-Ditylum_brightwellii.AAC.1